MESPFKSTVLAGRVALVTGGGSGIGLEVTRQLGAGVGARSARAASRWRQLG